MPIDDIPHTEVTCFLYHESGGYIQSSLLVADYSAKADKAATSSVDPPDLCAALLAGHDLRHRARW